MFRARTGTILFILVNKTDAKHASQDRVHLADRITTILPTELYQFCQTNQANLEIPQICLTFTE